MTLKPSEKRLLIGFGIMGFLAVNVGAWTILQQKDVSLKAARTKLEVDYKHLLSLQSQTTEAAFYQATLQKHLTAYASLDDRDTYLGNFVQSGVNSLQLKLAKNAPLAVEFPDPEKGGDFIKSSYQAEVAGDWKRVLEFIHRLQSPTEFRYTKNLTLTTRKSEAQDGAAELVCNFVLQKWWHPDSQTLLDEQAAAKELAGTPPPVPAPAPSAPVAPAAEEPESPAPSEASPAVAPVAPPSPQ